MTRTLVTLVTIAALMAVPPAMGLAHNEPVQIPDFGNRDFQAHLQRDVGLLGSAGGTEAPCPTMRGVPVPRSWGPDWRLSEPWMRELERTGIPPGSRRQGLPESPDQKWAQQVEGYRSFLITHPFNGGREWYRKHDHFLQYLEQDWYNYWHRLRYGANPPEHTSHYFGWG